MLSRSLCCSVWVVVLWIVVPDKQEDGSVSVDLASIVASEGPELFLLLLLLCVAALKCFGFHFSQSSPVFVFCFCIILYFTFDVDLKAG